MIEFNIYKSFENLKLNFNFDIESSGVTALFGKSGAGKSSIINMIAGILEPDGGFIKFNDTVFFDSAKKINLPVYKRGVGYIFQDAKLFPHLNVKKNLLYGRKRISNTDFDISFDFVISLLGISHLLDRKPNTLSGGEKQRVAIGRALLSKPDILLMDEPLASLDQSRRDELIGYIRLITKNFNIPIIYVSHAKDEIVRLANNIIFIENGNLIDSGNALKVLNNILLHEGLSNISFGTYCEGVVTGYNKEKELATIKFLNNEVVIASNYTEIGTHVRFKLLATEVILSNEKITSSARNLFNGVVKEIIQLDDYFANIHIDIGTLIWARIAMQSVRELKIEKDNSIYVAIKSAGIAANLALDTP